MNIQTLLGNVLRILLPAIPCLDYNTPILSMPISRVEASLGFRALVRINVVSGIITVRIWIESSLGREGQVDERRWQLKPKAGGPISGSHLLRPYTALQCSLLLPRCSPLLPRCFL
jgi:hypothetical protein